MPSGMEERMGASQSIDNPSTDEARAAERVRPASPVAATEEDQQPEMASADNAAHDEDDLYRSATPPSSRMKLQPGYVPTDSVQVSNSEQPAAAAVHSTQRPATEAAAVHSTGHSATEAAAVQSAQRSATEAAAVQSTGHPAAEAAAVQSTGHPAAEAAAAQGTQPSAPEPAAVNDTENPVQGNNHEPSLTSNQAPENPAIQAKVTDDPEFMAAAAAQKNNQTAEWQFNPSDAESSSSSDDSDDSSDSSDTDSEDGYQMLSAAAAAKILMSGDGEGGDDAGRAGGTSGADHQPRTIHEIKEVPVIKPDVKVTAAMKITLLGDIMGIVACNIVIQARTTGEYQVLEPGSVLCNQDRVVIGAVAETFGRVQQPLYSVAFDKEQEIKEVGLAVDSPVYYVNDHSKFEFTQPLKNLKGTDASNIHDEEIGEDDLEFSDDEAEAEHKRAQKAAKRPGRGGSSRADFQNGARNVGPTRPAGAAPSRNTGDAPAQNYGGGMNYDEESAPQFYQPLRRPDNLTSLMADGPPPPRPQPSYDRGQGRGRGDRGRDRGRADRGRGRGSDRGRGRNGFEPRGAQFDRSATFSRPSRGTRQRGNANGYPDCHNDQYVNDRRPITPRDDNSLYIPQYQQQAGFPDHHNDQYVSDRRPITPRDDNNSLYISQYQQQAGFPDRHNDQYVNDRGPTTTRDDNNSLYIPQYQQQAGYNLNGHNFAQQTPTATAMAPTLAPAMTHATAPAPAPAMTPTPATTLAPAPAYLQYAQPQQYPQVHQYPPLQYSLEQQYARLHAQTQEHAQAQPQQYPRPQQYPQQAVAHQAYGTYATPGGFPQQAQPPVQPQGPTQGGAQTAAVPVDVSAILAYFGVNSESDHRAE